MIKKALLETLYEGASMQRWNDKIRPVDLREIDKQAHKMIIAYVIGKFERDYGESGWLELIEGGIFEFLQRLVVTDLKPQIFNEIKRDPKNYQHLNQWVFEQLRPVIGPLGEGFCNRFLGYFTDTAETLSKKILGAAHFYASWWEFKIIERANPDGYEIPETKRRLEETLEGYHALDGMKQLIMGTRLKNFVDLCGQLRFQLRWSHIHMTPRMSVLGHMLIVAMLAYLFSLEIGACRRRRLNNYFTGLFHDLPEVLTRDIVSPVKTATKELHRMIKQYERRQMEKEVYRLIPEDWHPEMRMYTEAEFTSAVRINEKRVRKSSDEIQEKFNEDKFDPMDGEIIRAIDRLAAYIEADLATKNGIKSRHLEEAKNTIRQEYRGRRSVIAGIDFTSLYADFES